MPGPKREPFDPWLIPPEPPPSHPQPPATQGPQTVSQITSLIKQAITRLLPATVHVVGQVSNLKRQTSGHLYFTLKDDHSELPCVMWRTEALRLKFKPEDGLEVVASGAVEIFDRAGRYQLYVRRLETRGVGSLELAFRQLCERLAKEGLFDETRKKKLSRFPRRIAIVTSPTGAAIADILRTIRKRYPCVHLLIAPVRVQGDGASMEIASAIRMLNLHADRLGGLDLIIVGRGGGSLEDLWAFNEEVVARAIFSGTIPVISGVGHEIDTTIADLVADARAATPTAAAIMAVPLLDDVLQSLDGIQNQLKRSIGVRVEKAEHTIQSFAKRIPFRDPLGLIRNRAQFLDLVLHKAYRSQLRTFGAVRTRLERIERVVQRITPRALLNSYSSRLARLERGLGDRLSTTLSLRLRRTQAAAAKLQRFSPEKPLEITKHRVLNDQRKIQTGEMRHVHTLSARLQHLAGLLQAVSHQSVLARGYSITRLKNGKKILRSVADVQPADVIQTQLQDGAFDSTVHP